MTTNNRIAWISTDDPPDAFPDISRAMREPDGLLAAGGDLSGPRLLAAYRLGIFPWFDSGQSILWWSPDPRCVLFPGKFHASRRLRRELRNSDAEIRFNTRFERVIARCAEPRPGQHGTWITPEMIAAYTRLHRDGWAHSIEVWQHDVLIGGLYGIAIGRVFFGESMFSRQSNASKYALYAASQYLRFQEFALIDCQVMSHHLTTLGATLMPRDQFAGILKTACEPPRKFRAWPGKPVPARAIEALGGNAALQ
ncbi:MAG TPA: leucyl/phenylalanyl-tRNA--protein transferase [Woeseiaceae bacterium]|nr:leucyl/phenylalanyl-tRNA--protein transferase [Woeseiaceae bacterium]